MRGLLVRVGIDQTYGGWNAPCRADGSFCYIPMQPIIPEVFGHGFETTYDQFEIDFQAFVGQNGIAFPNWLQHTICHLDPDFRFLSYGDGGKRATRITTFFEGSQDNFIAFYASFTSIDQPQNTLTYAIIALYRFQTVGLASDVPLDRRNQNAHTRLANYQQGSDIVIVANEGSGRLRHLIPIGERRANGHYYVRLDLFDAWGGISSRNGWIQRSVYLPHFCKPEMFLQWFDAQNVQFVHENNIAY